MQLWDAINPVELTGYVRAALADLSVNAFTLGRWLPNRDIPDLNYRFNQGGQGLADAATFRTYDAESPIGKRPSAKRVSGELPPISRKLRLGEYDQLRLRNADQEIQDAVFNDAVRLVRQIAARLELARGEALYTGKVVLNENGVVATADYGRAAGHTVSAGTVWSNPAALALTDLLAWQTTYNATNGENPAIMLFSTTVLGYLLKNTEIRDLLRTGPSTITRVSRTDLTGVLSDHGLPPFEVYDAQVRVNDVATRVIPADRVVFLPAPDPNPDTNELGATLYGVPAGALEDGNFTPTDQPGVYSAAYKELTAPHGVWTETEAIAFPVVANPDLTFTADVA